jgi:hypothetical protein
VKIGQLYSGGIIANYRCSARCAHCLYASSPTRDGSYITPTTARRIFEAVAAKGCQSLHIGGGEPLLHPDELCALLDAATACDIHIEYVETNASWYRDDPRSDRLLNRLLRHGLSTLLISMDPFHVETIPFAKVEGVTAACNRCGIHPFRWQETFASELQQFDPATTHSLDAFEAKFGADYVTQLFSRYGLTFGGRAAMTFRDRMPRRSAVEVAADAPPCAERLTSTSHFHVDLHGHYIPSLCTGLAIDVSHIDRPIDPARYPVLTRLHDEGIAGLLDHAIAKHHFTPDPGGYVNHCDLCLAIRAHLTRHAPSRDLAPIGFYDELFPG